MEGEFRAGAHIDALDGARGLAVTGVLLFHGGHLTGGYLGVDFFFTLSGFLITSLLLAEVARTGRVGLGGFWARRARRLLPALAVLMVGVAAYAAILAKPDELAQIRGDAFATLAYAANWRAVFSGSDYWAIFRAPSPLNHTWSLAIEEQFYLVWPLAIVALVAPFRRDTARAVLVTSLVLAAVSSVLMIVLYDPANTARVYYGTDTRAAAILFGAALAAGLAIHGPVRGARARLLLECAGLAGVAVLAVAWTRLDGQSATLYRGGFLVCGLAATAVIATAVHPDRKLVARLLSWRALCALGLVSYGVYLYHWPLDVVLDEQRVHLTGWPLFAIQTAVVLVLAYVSYRVVEQPVRRGTLIAVRWQRVVPAAAVALVAMIVASTAGARSEGPIAQLRTANAALDATEAALRTAPPRAERVMLVGNSVAYELGSSFRAIRRNPPVAVVDAGRAPCRFPPVVRIVPSLNAPPCGPSWEADIVKQLQPDVVFWIMSDATNGTIRLLYHGRTLQPCTASYDALYRQSLRAEIERLGAGGATVVITTEAYSRTPGVERADHMADCNNRLRREVAAQTGARLVDLFSYVCPRGVCRVKLGGVTLRPDGQHYLGPGGLLIARWLLAGVGLTRYDSGAAFVNETGTKAVDGLSSPPTATHASSDAHETPPKPAP